MKKFAALLLLLGLFVYSEGKSVPQDYTKAAEWYRKAAEHGYAGAQSNLAGMYYGGLGVPQDYAKAAEWYRKAAEQGNPDAQNNLPKVEEALKKEQSAKIECTTHCGQGEVHAVTAPDVKPSDDGHVALLLIGCVPLLVIIIGLINGRRKDDQAKQSQLDARNELIKNEQAMQSQLDEQSKQCRDIIVEIVKKHTQELSTREHQLVTFEAYGLKNTKSWEKEKQNFIDQVIMPAIKAANLPSNATMSFALKRGPVTLPSLLDLVIKDFRDAHPTLAGLNYSEECSPVEYEQYCAHLLAEAGWKVRTTIATGDQGGDIIATKRGTTVVIQCKKYSSAVGNSAVQEVFAAKSYYDADKAVVVSNATYTMSAKQIAGKTGVLLLHHNDLLKLGFMPSAVER